MDKYQIINTTHDRKYLWKVWDCIEKQSIAEFIKLEDARLFMKAKDEILLH